MGRYLDVKGDAAESTRIPTVIVSQHDMKIALCADLRARGIEADSSDVEIGGFSPIMTVFGIEYYVESDGSVSTL